MTYEEKKIAFGNAVASTMFMSELAYEISYRWTDIIGSNKEMFHHEAKQLLSRYIQSMKNYNGWVLRATGNTDNLRIIRSISDELNSIADDELYKFRLSVENKIAKHGVPYPKDFAMLEIMYYTVSMANVCGKEKFGKVRKWTTSIKNYYPMRMDAQLHIIKELRSLIQDRFVKDVIDLNDDGLITNGITSICRVIMDNCNKVCETEGVAV